MALKLDPESDIDLQENSLDNSADSELLGMVDEGSFVAGDRHYFDKEDGTSYQFKDISGAVCAYKIVHMEDGTSTVLPGNSPTHSAEYYVLSNNLEVDVPGVIGTPAVVKQKIVKKAAIPAKVVTTAKKRDDKRRATHNEVERRRRDKINSWITKLAALVPDTGLPDTASKGGILAKACDHITSLNQRLKKADKLQTDNGKLVQEVLRLNQELSELRKENIFLRSQLADNCIVIDVKAKGQKS